MDEDISKQNVYYPRQISTNSYKLTLFNRMYGISSITVMLYNYLYAMGVIFHKDFQIGIHRKYVESLLGPPGGERLFIFRDLRSKLIVLRIKRALQKSNKKNYNMCYML